MSERAGDGKKTGVSGPKSVRFSPNVRVMDELASGTERSNAQPATETKKRGQKRVLLRFAITSDDDPSPISELLRQRADPNEQDRRGRSILSLAICKRCSRVASLLLESSASANSADSGGWTPLHEAVREGLCDIAKQLIAHNANPRSLTAARDWSALHIAARKGLSGIVRALIEAEADVNSMDREGMSPISMAAARKSDPSFIRTLISLGADPVTRDRRLAWTPLHHAAHAGASMSTIRALVVGKADLESSDVNGRDALCVAAQEGNVEACEALIDCAGLKGGVASLLRRVDSQGRTALLAAAEFGGNSDVYKLLILHGSAVGALDLGGETVLHKLASRVRCESSSISLMASSGADARAKSDAGWTALHIACRAGREPAVRALLDAKASPNARGVDAATPLHAAAISWHRQATTIVQLLLERKADPHMTTSERGLTAYDAAVDKGQSAVAQLLWLECSPDEHRAVAKDDSKKLRALIQSRKNESNGGVGPVSSDVVYRGAGLVATAVRNGSFLALKVLVDEKFGDLDRPDEDGMLPLTRALTPPLTTHADAIAMALIAAKASVNKGPLPPLLCAVELHSDVFRMRTIKALLNAKAQPGGGDVAGTTALHVAARGRDMGVIRVLVDAKADVTAADNAGRTALHMALDGNLDSSDSDDSESEEQPQKLDAESPQIRLKTREIALVTVRMLLDAKAQPEAADGTGETPVRAAKAKRFKHGYRIMKAVMKAAGSPEKATSAYMDSIRK